MKMKILPEDMIKLLYHVLIGAALLLLSAVAENGETAMSATLVPRASDVPRMIEALLAGMTATVAFGAASAYLMRENT